MSTLFENYELIAKSGLFDQQYYLKAHPQVAASGADPLLHYLEEGAAAGFSPSPDFDVGYYLAQCRFRGEAVDNPLLHFISTGLAMGLSTRRGDRPAGTVSPVTPFAIQPFKMWLEWPQITDGAAVSPVSGNLTVEGWALAAEGIEAVEIHVDGQFTASAQYGFRRDDVAQSIKEYDDALHCGFAAVLPVWRLKKGAHTVSVVLRDRRGRSAQSRFSIQVDKAAEENGHWALRQKIPQAELGLKNQLLVSQRWRPDFVVALRCPQAPLNLAALRGSLASLARQCYPHWRLLILSAAKAGWPATQRAALLKGYEELQDRVIFVTAADMPLTQQISPAMRGNAWLLPMAVGDELGSDCLLELALASAKQREADLLYFDERRFNPLINALDAFFKPGWSPDLLESSNYLGRAWMAPLSLLRKAGVSAGEWLRQGDYHLVLRLSEQAGSIHHLPRILMRSAPNTRDRINQERTALRQHFRRTGRGDGVGAGLVVGTHKAIAQRRISGLVSIVIATCASRGLIKRCIESLRATTGDDNIEIVCIENIPARAPQWKDWLRENTDTVIATDEPFNWARYNNLAARHASGDYLLFLNDDIEALEPGWLQALLEVAARTDVGVVGPLLLYPNRTVQHAGLALTQIVGRARHSFRHAQEDDPGYFGLAHTRRNVIGVTGACLLTKRETFARLKGFDEAYTVVNNDVDYCFRCREAGLLNVYTPYAKLIHHELASRGDLGDAYDSARFTRRWRHLYEQGDPYLNANLSRDYDDMTPQREPMRSVYAGHPVVAREAVKKILVVKLDHIGDCITALPAVRRLKQYFPAASISVLSGKAAKAIWSLCPEVDRVIEFDYFHERSGAGVRRIKPAEMCELEDRLKPERFDLAVDLRKSPNARQVLLHVGARFLAGFDHQFRFPWLDIALEWEDDMRKSRKRNHVADDLLHLVHAIGTATEPRRLTVPTSLPRLQSTPELRQLFRKRVVCVHPSAGTDTRQWPLPYFARLIDLLLEDDTLNIALIGSPAEQPAAQQVLKQVKSRMPIFNLVGKHPLANLPSLLAQCSLFVGNNSGPQHLAAGLGVPTIGIHSGVVDANEWGPLGPSAVAIQRQMSCSPCYIPSKKDCPRQMACLSGIEPMEIAVKCREMLNLRRD